MHAVYSCGGGVGRVFLRALILLGLSAENRGMAGGCSRVSDADADADRDWIDDRRAQVMLHAMNVVTDYAKFSLVFAIVVAVWTLWCARRGSIGVLFFFARKQDRPRLFWLSVIVFACGAVLIGANGILIMLGLIPAPLPPPAPQ